MPINEFNRSLGPSIAWLIFVLFVVLILPNSGLARMYEEPKSFSLQGLSQEQTTSLKQVEQKVLSRVDVEGLLAEDRMRSKRLERPEPLRFAVASDAFYSLENSGTLQELPDGHLWRLRIHSPNAKSHNLGITRFDMPDGAKLWIYNLEHTHVEGPYTARHRSHRGSLWTPIIEGDEIVVEVFMPANVSKPAIEITKINRGYRIFEKDARPPNSGTSGNCNVHAKCAASSWSDSIRSVGAYTNHGTYRCTGTMLNNTKRDHTPYFLSAYHCGVNSTNDDSIVVYWNYQVDVPDCTKPFNPHSTPNWMDNQIGAEFLASDTQTDFLLLKLSYPPDPSFSVRYSGWDARTTPPLSTPIVGIHHPWLDVKAISTSNTNPTSTDYLSRSTNPAGNHWRVIWNFGVTEGASSGSCLFDSGGRCIGQLHGGNPLGCDPLIDNNPNTIPEDWYGKFSASWNMMKPWLDPAPGTGEVSITGDPHITTSNDVHYDFQAAGEFVSLRDPSGLEIQTRQTPVPTANIVADSYSELPVCVSVNTAVATRVGGHSVSYQPKASSTSNPNSLELFIDDNPATVGPNGLDLSGGGRVVKTTVPGGLEFDFPDGSVLFATPGWWGGPNIWYFNLNLTRPPAIDGSDADSFPIGGIAGPIESGDWLPRLPNGNSMGPRPGGLQERYADLYQKFADAWRVTNESSLFTYAPGTSTANFTLRSWPPPLNSPCTIPQGLVHGAPSNGPVKSIKLQTAIRACLGITDKHARQNCIFDVQVTADLGFAKVYRFSERVVDKTSRTTVSYDKSPIGLEEKGVVTATVAQARADGRHIPTGSVQFIVDGRKVGKPIPLDKNGQAQWKTASLQVGKHQVSANYIPDKKSRLFRSMGVFKEPTEDRS